jgi:hypothetical protein
MTNKRVDKIADEVRQQIKDAEDPVAKFIEIVKPFSISKHRHEVVRLCAGGCTVLQICAYVKSVHDIDVSTYVMRNMLKKWCSSESSTKVDLALLAQEAIDSGRIAAGNVVSKRSPLVPAKVTSAGRKEPSGQQVATGSSNFYDAEEEKIKLDLGLTETDNMRMMRLVIERKAAEVAKRKEESGI